MMVASDAQVRDPSPLVSLTIVALYGTSLLKIVPTSARKDEPLSIGAHRMAASIVNQGRQTYLMVGVLSFSQLEALLGCLISAGNKHTGPYLYHPPTRPDYWLTIVMNLYASDFVLRKDTQKHYIVTWLQHKTVRFLIAVNVNEWLFKDN